MIRVDLRHLIDRRADLLGRGEVLGDGDGLGVRGLERDVAPLGGRQLPVEDRSG